MAGIPDSTDKTTNNLLFLLIAKNKDAKKTNQATAKVDNNKVNLQFPPAFHILYEQLQPNPGN